MLRMHTKHKFGEVCRKVVVFVSFVLTLGFVSLIPLISVDAQAAYVLPEMKNNNRLTVKLQLPDIENPQIKHTLPNAKLRLTQIAVMQINTVEKSVHYHTLDAYSRLGITWENMTASQSNELAQIISTDLENPSSDAIERRTDTAGDAVFDQLENGIYLIEYLDENESSYEVEMAPFLITVPLYRQEMGENVWIDQVEAYPKMGTAKQSSSTETTTNKSVSTSRTSETTRRSLPKTGEQTNSFIPMVLLAVAIILVFIDKRMRDKA